MGAEGFSIIPPELHAAAGVFSAEAAHLRQALAAWQAAVAKAGACWGDDEGGTKFAANYLPGKDAIERALGVLCEGIASVDPALRAVADNTVQRDKTNAETLS